MNLIGFWKIDQLD